VYGALTSTNDSRDALLLYARKSFEFLEAASGSRTKTDNNSARTVLAYTVGSITVEVQLDWHEGAALVLLCRTVDGKRPPGYYRHAGRLMRKYLALALDDGEPQDQVIAAELKAITRQSGPEAMRLQIDASSSAVRGIVDRFPEFHERLFPD